MYKRQVIAMTNLGYIKRMDADNFRLQNRGGKGIKGMQTIDEDYIEDLLMTTNHHYVMFFTNTGRVYRLKAYEIPEAGRTSRGTAVSYTHLDVYKRQGVPCRIDMHLKKNKTKGIAVNGIPVHKASELFGIANVVFFSPEDLNIIKNGPAERRRFVDLELCQLNKLYVHSLIHYNKTLVQRNKLLKELAFRPEYEPTLDVWDQQLVTYGKQVMEYRKDFMGQLNEIIRDIHLRLSGEKENLNICYDPNVLPEEFESALKRSREQDIRQKTTLCGPHTVSYTHLDVYKRQDIRRS